MGSDTQAKFSYTTYVTLDNLSGGSGVYGQVTPISTLGAGAAGVYGQVTPVSTAGNEPAGVYGQVTPVSTASVEPVGVYGQVVAVSGFDFDVVTSNVSGVGDIIYYGDAGSITVDECQLLGGINDVVLVSGLAMPSADYSALADDKSGSVVFSVESGVAQLPTGATRGVYLYFSNHNGLVFSVSGVENIVTSAGSSMSVSLSGVGSHLGVIGDGTKWIATEEGGIL